MTRIWWSDNKNGAYVPGWGVIDHGLMPGSLTSTRLTHVQFTPHMVHFMWSSHGITSLWVVTGLAGNPLFTPPPP